MHEPKTSAPIVPPFPLASTQCVGGSADAMGGRAQEKVNNDESSSEEGMLINIGVGGVGDLGNREEAQGTSKASDA